MPRKIFSLLYLLVFTLILVTGCEQQANHAYQPRVSSTSTQKASVYVIGIHPLHNPQRLMHLYGPIVDYINRHISEADFRLEASRNYEEFERKLYAGHFAFAMPNPYQTMQSTKYGYHIFGKMSDDDVFRGIILVRRDSDIKQVTDLKGKIVSYPSATALAATMMPQFYLHTHGLDVNRDIENRYVGSQESSIENVLRGHVAAGATWPVPWSTYVAEHPEKASLLEVKWETEPLLNNGWVVRSDIPQQITEQFSKLLFSLHNHPEGRLMLKELPISSFEPATDETYRPVGIFLEQFSRNVRKIEY